uniref:Uncharacterized protein n=1 Tax=Accipiter nisus TaxID=211598 RepID=A0A8B9MYB8_9AVES
SVGFYVPNLCLLIIDLGKKKGKKPGSKRLIRFLMVVSRHAYNFGAFEVATNHKTGKIIISLKLYKVGDNTEGRILGLFF